MIIEGLLVALVVAIGSSFLAGGLLLIKGAAGHLWERWQTFFEALESRRWPTTTGQVTRAVVSYTTSRRARTYVPAVRYTYSVDGETFVSDRFAFVVDAGVGEEGAARAQAVIRRFAAGDVQIYYDPDQPRRAVLDRSVPPLLAPTLGWLFTLLLGGGTMLYIGTGLALGPFEGPPDLGDVPSLTAQMGGLATAVGTVFVLLSGVRAVGAAERRQRRLLRWLRSARPALVQEVRAGEPVMVSGRVEDLADDPHANGDGALPFEDAPLVYYDTDAEWFRRTFFTVFGVRDASGAVLVEIEATESTVLESRQLRVEGEVERWLDEQREESDEPIPAYPECLRFERIRAGDRVLVAGCAEREDDGLVFRARAGAPTSLLVAQGSPEEVLTRLGKRPGRTRLLLLLGSGLIVAGIVAMLLA